MTLGQTQRKFAGLIGQLLVYIYSKGYEVTFGDAWAKTGHKANSNHYIRLAIDLNLFKDGNWLQDTEDHREFGEYWESLGGAWGGRFKDGNHYSMEYEGRK